MAGHQEQQTRPVAIVTGASGGIGEASARALQAAGYRVFGTYRRPPATMSRGIEYLACDVTSDESVQTAVGQVLAKAGRIDLLVNNAGVGLVAGAEESSVEQAKSLFDVNLFGVFRLTNAVLPAMRRQGSGRIVNISSVMGLIPAPFMALYAASKHALEGYSESLDHEIRATRDSTQGRIVRDVALGVAHFLAAIEAGEVDAAQRCYLGFHDDLHRIGGSRAQRQLFEILYSRVA
jgi:NAD(P)-dependent dehydrogenase (short-subunit alcohol dehydrogenase family)